MLESYSIQNESPHSDDESVHARIPKQCFILNRYSARIDTRQIETPLDRIDTRHESVPTLYYFQRDHEEIYSNSVAECSLPRNPLPLGIVLNRPDNPETPGHRIGSKGAIPLSQLVVYSRPYSQHFSILEAPPFLIVQADTSIYKEPPPSRRSTEAYPLIVAF